MYLFSFVNIRLVFLCDTNWSFPASALIPSKSMKSDKLVLGVVSVDLFKGQVDNACRLYKL